ncbi:putative RING-H2 finger protein ATL21A [Camellia lanceoleosa]|uniref:RING-H2 finger protein ATL21A n=1 Tax=Camellia lanceoleosa TaxID=1840588 RepID=A0ACC0GYQ3_9ERIC|nr:putative RING-H2 finger protein ATL21A [Camellia lanceoleosa]
MQMAMIFFFLLFLFLLLLFQLQGVVFAAGAPQAPLARSLNSDECTVTQRCGEYGPDIRFPFWLKDHQPNHCGYPGFELSCSPTNLTMLELVTVTVFVQQINYIDQSLYISDPSSCFPEQLLLNLNHSLSVSPFKFSPHYYPGNFSFFSCPSSTMQTYPFGWYDIEYAYYRHSPFPITNNCHNSSQGHVVYVVPDDFLIQQFLLSCRKLYTVTSTDSPLYGSPDLDTNELRLSWSKPICGRCDTTLLDSSSCSHGHNIFCPQIK